MAIPTRYCPGCNVWHRPSGCLLAPPSCFIVFTPGERIVVATVLEPLAALLAR